MSNPRHIAIIMDGNGRWAQSRGLPRSAGHKAGMEALRKIVNHASRIKLQWLTLFAFSSENWSRPQSEVDHLLGLLKIFVRRDLLNLQRENVCIKVIGDRGGLSTDIVALLDEAETLTKTNTGLHLVVAFNYGGRNELVRATKVIAEKVRSLNLDLDKITEDVISHALDTNLIPDPDLIIRTSGELRLSNFLLWQAAYSEFYFSEATWPDFSTELFDDAIHCYLSRDRRFGGLDNDRNGEKKVRSHD